MSRTGLITWVNIENIGGKVQVCKFARKWKNSMKLTMWRVVVVLNMYTKFREKYSPSPFIHSIVANPRVHIKDNNNSPHEKFHRFSFPFSSKCRDLNFAPYVLYIYPCYEKTYVTQTVSLDYLCFNQMATIRLLYFMLLLPY